MIIMIILFSINKSSRKKLQNTAITRSLQSPCVVVFVLDLVPLSPPLSLFLSLFLFFISKKFLLDKSQRWNVTTLVDVGYTSYDLNVMTLGRHDVGASRCLG